MPTSGQIEYRLRKWYSICPPSPAVVLDPGIEKEEDKVTGAALHGGSSYKKHVKALIACWLFSWLDYDLVGHMSGEL